MSEESITIADIEAAMERIEEHRYEPHVHLVNPRRPDVCVECGAPRLDTQGDETA